MITILNSGGTFNKIYNPITGNLDVAQNSEAIEEIVQTFSYSIEIEGLIYKDSLELTHEDRVALAEKIETIDGAIVLVHGTDTIDKTAQFLDEHLKGRLIVLTGAMIPFSINPIEATVNLAMAIQYAKALTHSGVYIAMQGEVAHYTHLKKDKEQGVFRRV